MRESEREDGGVVGGGLWGREAIMTGPERLPVDEAFVFTLKYDLYFHQSEGLCLSPHTGRRAREKSSRGRKAPRGRRIRRKKRQLEIF